MCACVVVLYFDLYTRLLESELAKMSKKYLENIHVGVLGIMQFFFPCIFARCRKRK